MPAAAARDVHGGDELRVVDAAFARLSRACSGGHDEAIAPCVTPAGDAVRIAGQHGAPECCFVNDRGRRVAQHACSDPHQFAGHAQDVGWERLLAVDGGQQVAHRCALARRIEVALGEKRTCPSRDRSAARLDEQACQPRMERNPLHRGAERGQTGVRPRSDPRLTPV